MAGALTRMGRQKPKRWIGSAIQHPGRLTAAAKRAGQSISEYARAHEHDPKGSIGDAARMYENVLKPSSRKGK